MLKSATNSKDGSGRSDGPCAGDALGPTRSYRVAGPAGATGSFQCSFDEGRTTFIAESQHGQLSRLIKIRIGRLAVLWNIGGLELPAYHRLRAVQMGLEALLIKEYPVEQYPYDATREPYRAASLIFRSVHRSA